MKRIILFTTLALLAAFCLVLTACTSSDEGASKGLELALTEDETAYAVTGLGACTDTEIVIPSQYKGKPVVAIGEKAFYLCSRVTSVTIPDSVTEMGDSAFAYCENLTSVTVGNGVTAIAESAFADCPSLTSIAFGEGLKYIRKHAFASCISLTSVTLPANTTYIAADAFLDCFRLTEVINHSSLDITVGEENHGRVALYATEVHTGESHLEPFGDYVFYPFDGVYSMVAYMGSDTDLVLPADYKGAPYVIRPYAFYGRKELSSVIFSEGVTEIGVSAFQNCSGLSEITIPDSVTRIGKSAFEGCSGVSLLSVPFVGETCNEDENAYIGHIFGAKGAPRNDDMVPGSLKTVIVRGECTLARHAFFHCSGIKKVVLENVTRIGAGAFESCRNLTEVILSDELTGIDDFAFYHCQKLASVVIPGGVTKIGNDAFLSCTALTSVVMEDGVMQIGNNAFYNCYSLVEATLPATLTEIGDSAFSGCEKLASVAFYEGLSSIGSSAFFNCHGLTSVTIPMSVMSLGAECFAYCSGLTDIYYSGSMEQWYAILQGMVIVPGWQPTVIRYNSTPAQ